MSGSKIEKIFRIIIITMICFTMVAFPLDLGYAYAADIVESGTCGDNLTWTLTGTNEYTLTISGTGEMSDYNGSGQEPPWYSEREMITKVVVENGVTSIGNYAFLFCSNLTEISITNSVSRIGNYTFMFCFRLTDISIPESVTSIGDGAFYECSGLKSISFPEGLMSLGDNATFHGCKSLTSISIPDCVTSIGFQEFYGCSGLTYINIPENVTSIGEYAFYNCSNLTSAAIPDDVTNVNYQAFHKCDKLKNVVYYGTDLNWSGISGISSSDYYNTALTSATRYDVSITCPEYAGEAVRPAITVKQEETALVQGTDYSVSFGNETSEVDEIGEATVSFMGSYAALGIVKHEYKVLPKSSNIVASGTCGDNLTWTLDSEGLLTISGEGEMTSWNHSIYVSWANYKEEIQNVSIEKGVTNIGRFAFDGCSNLINITIPEGVTNIENSAFNGCSSLTNITIPESMINIGFEAFRGCSSLAGIEIPEGVTFIGLRTFTDCSSLNSIIIPDSVTSIGDYVFTNCTSLTTVLIPESVTTIGSGVFTNINEQASLYVVEGSSADNFIKSSGYSGMLKYVTKEGEHYWYEEIATEPGCKTSGSKTITCVKCGETRTEEIAALGHDYHEIEGTAAEPTPWEPGKEADQQCLRCGDIKTGEPVYFNIDSLEFIPAEDIRIVEGTGGHIEIMDIYDPETDSYHQEEFYYYDILNFVYTEGNRIIINGNEEFIYKEYMDDGEIYSYDFVNDNGERLTSKYGNLNSSDDQRNNHWTADNDYQFTLTLLNETSEGMVTIVENPVKSIEFIPAEKLERIENTEGYYTTNQVYDPETDTYYDEEFYYYYCYDLVNSEGNKIRINGEEEFTCQQYMTDPYSSMACFVNGDGELLTSKYGDLEISDDQWNNHWIVDNEYTINITLLGVSTEGTVKIVENPIKTIEVIPSEFELIEGMNGNTDYRQVWDEDTQSYIQEEYFYYQLYGPLEKEGTQIVVNGTDVYTYGQYCTSDGCYTTGFFNENNEEIRISSIYDTQYQEPWEAGGTYTATIECMGARYDVTFRVIENPVIEIGFEFAEPLVYIKDAQGSYTTIPEYNEQGEYIGDKEVFIYNWPNLCSNGNKITVKTKDGSNEYIFSNTAGGFCDSDGNCIIQGYEVDNFYYEDQLETSWTLGDDNYLTVGYMGHYCRVPVTIIENPVKSIKYIPAQDLVAYFNPGHSEIINYNLWFNNGDVIEVTNKDGSVIKYTYGYYPMGIAQKNFISDDGNIKSVYDFYLYIVRDDPTLHAGDDYVVRAKAFYMESEEVPLTMLEDNVRSVSLELTHPVNAREYDYETITLDDGSEGIQCWWRGRKGDTGDLQHYAIFRQGDTITVTDTEGKVTVYTFDEDESMYGFFDAKGKELPSTFLTSRDNGVYNWDEQDQSKRYWSADKENEIYFSYLGHDAEPIKVNIEDVQYSLGDAEVTVGGAVYTGYELKPEVTVNYEGRELTEGVDYTVSYENNVNAGKASVTVTGTGKYTGAKTVEFMITPQSATPAIKLAPNKFVYDGKEHLPDVTVTVNNKEVPANIFIPSNCVNPGVYTIKVSLIGNYTGSATADFEITHEHAWDEGKVTQAATCTSAGVKTFTCTVCGDTRTEEITALGHNFTDTIISPTCTTEGYTEHVCGRCGYTFRDSIIHALGHDWNEPTWTWTGDADTGFTAAKATFVCKNDDTHKREVEDTAIEKTTVDPTPSVGGKITYTAEVTGPDGKTYSDKKEKSLHPAGYTYDDPVYTWTETADGYTCTALMACKEDPTKNITDTATVTYAVTTPATCEAAGTGTYTATFTNTAFETKTKEVTIPAKGHTLTAHAATAATCEAAGNSAYWSCSECGRYFSDAEGKTEIAADSWIIPALDHDWSEWVVTKEATDDEEGVETRVCRRDPSHTETRAIPKIDNEVIRIFGSTRFETSLNVAKELKERLGVEKFSAVVVTNGGFYPDALSGSYLSGTLKAPVLLMDTSRERISAVQSFIRENLEPGGMVYLLGGKAVVPDSVMTGLDGFEHKRLGGATRYETNISIIEEASGGKVITELIVCSGNGFADSLSAAATGKPIMILNTTLLDCQKKYLDGLNTHDLKITIVGGTGVIGNALENSLKAYGTTERVWGQTRYETSAKVASRFFPQTTSGIIALGQNFPDGLCGGVLANTIGGPMVLVANGTTANAEQYAQTSGMSSGIVLGGPLLLSDKTARTVFHLSESDEIPQNK